VFLRAKEEYLQTTNEELATSNEELKSANEEMQSVNEELQSTNEELETSKEELQSVNEELGTVNTELQNKVADLSRSNNDMNNLLAGTGIGTIFVDYQLRIQRFTPTVTQVINLILTDVGRPVSHIVSNLVGYDRLAADVREVQPLSRFILPEDQDIHYQHRKASLETGAPQSWALRVLKKDAVPFWVRVDATTAQGADGASVWRAVVSDITESKRAERAVKTTNAELQEFAYALAHDLQEPLRMVVNFSQLLAEEYAGKLGEHADRYFAYSVEGALRIEALQQGLLNYLEATERDSHRLSPVDCNRVLSQALSCLQTVMQQTGAAVTSDPLPTAVANEAMLMHLFQNLIGNSIKYKGEAAPQFMSPLRELQKVGCSR
jgi:PAS domain S-box-containing protein